MIIQDPNVLPPYPRKLSAAEATRLRVQRERYASAIQGLRDELILVEDAFTASLSVGDARAATRQRLTDMAAANRKH